MKPIIIGSRGSKLALAQSNWTAERMKELYPSLEISIKVIKTTGDKLTNASLVRLAGESKGLFVKEIEEALMAGFIDLAVHSLKDVPTELPGQLALGMIPRREDPRDAFLTPHQVSSFRELPDCGVIGTSSLRRRVQVRKMRPDLEILEIRGNVDTRLRKMHEQQLDGIILAAAGLRRMNLHEHIAFTFPVEEMIPAIGQGALAIEIRRDNIHLRDLLAPLEHETTRQAVMAERSFLKALGGGCQVPMGAHAELLQTGWRFSAFVCSPNGDNLISRTFSAPGAPISDLAGEASDYFRSKGAESILKEVHTQ